MLFTTGETPAFSTMGTRMTATATYALYYVIGLGVSAPLAKISVAYWNVWAQADGAIPSLPTGSDTVATAALGTVIAWLLGRTIPKLSEDHKEANNKLADKIEGMGNAIAAKIDDGNKEQIRYLRELSQVQRKQA